MRSVILHRTSCWHAASAPGWVWLAWTLFASALMTVWVKPVLAAGREEGVAIVVNLENPVTAVSADELISLYLGRSRQLANGLSVIPLDQMEGSEPRLAFYERVMNKSESQMNSYWSRLIFSGKGRPPYAVADDHEVLELIAANRNMLGYVRASAVTPQVKVILMVP